MQQRMVLAAALVAAIGQSVFATTFNEARLEAPSGYEQSDTICTSINNEGEIIGGLAIDSSGISRGLYWRNQAGSPMYLSAQGNSLLANGLSDQGLLAGTVPGIQDRPATAVRATAGGGFTVLSNLPGTLDSWTNGINGSGQVVGGAVAEVNGLAENWAIVWDADGSPTKIASSTNGICEARAVNSDGLVVGVTTVASQRGAFAWDFATGNLVQLPLLAGTSWAMAFGINDSGFVVGRSGDHAVMWSPDGAIIDLSPAFGFAAAYDINNCGWIVGEAGGRAVVWDTAGNLNLLCTTNSSAASINDSGCVVGSVTTADGHSHATLWTPVPEPSSLLALLAGMGSVVGMIRRRRRSR